MTEIFYLCGMNKPALLYISINDGSDTRINKEVRTLANEFSIHYLGIGKSQAQSFVRNYCQTFSVVEGSHKNPVVFLKYYFLFLKVYLSRSYQSIHVINENLMLLLVPFLWWQRKKIVLDIFDSIFLRSAEKWRSLQRLCYRLPHQLIVTDANRKELLPTEFHAKAVVVENYPYLFRQQVEKAHDSSQLTIFYNGSMSRMRGTDLLLAMLDLFPQLRIEMAGWVYDEATQVLSQHPQVNFLGTITQQESMQVAARCDYIFSLYEPINANNINASPNKIYDAIQAGTPVIINGEVKISSFVKENNLGYVMASFYETDYTKLFHEWLSCRSTYQFHDSLRHSFTWEAVEDKLLQSHLSVTARQSIVA